MHRTRENRLAMAIQTEWLPPLALRRDSILHPIRLDDDASTNGQTLKWPPFITTARSPECPMSWRCHGNRLRWSSEDVGWQVLRKLRLEVWRQVYCGYQRHSTDFPLLSLSEDLHHQFWNDFCCIRLLVMTYFSFIVTFMVWSTQMGRTGNPYPVGSNLGGVKTMFLKLILVAF